MATNEFAEIRAKAGDVERTDRWYQNAIRQMTRGIETPNEVFGTDLGSFETRIEPGNMYLYTYDAKHAETLPYYDRFPLTICIEPLSNIAGFSGINLHYLPPMMRAQVLSALRENVEEYTDDKTKIRSDWEVVKRFSLFPQVQGAVKKYIFSQVTSRLYKINPLNWRPAIFLPVQQFTGASAQTVYRRTLMQEERKKKGSIGMGMI